MTRPLSEQQIRDVIRANPDAIRKIAMVDSKSAVELSQRVTEIVFEHPEIVSSIVAAGLNLPPAEVEKMGAILRWLAAARIFAMTQGAHAPETLISVGLEEFSALAFDGEASDNLARLIFGSRTVQ
ncbi:hypothetical protein [Novosphingobium mathurense]|uniref:Uncharacterized protein n=1 Tax=Novosphingobium mathurense TaxID=428990 RepID=A0A1U6GY02_9SPHN|nr:hypothetical protein [Novosphingobium mathurense]SLJ88404.1 hypothetical protein SAMN06295987_101801 [Novosphingobium mathurense]